MGSQSIVNPNRDEQKEECKNGQIYVFSVAPTNPGPSEPQPRLNYESRQAQTQSPDPRTKT